MHAQAAHRRARLAAQAKENGVRRVDASTSQRCMHMAARACACVGKRRQALQYYSSHGKQLSGQLVSARGRAWRATTELNVGSSPLSAAQDGRQKWERASG